MRYTSVRTRTLGRVLAATAAITSALALSTGAAMAETSDGSESTTSMTTEHVDALVKPGIVFIYGQYSGHVRYTTSTGRQISPLVSAAYYCTGFVVSNAVGEATIATAGHCADRAEGKAPLISAFLSTQVNKGWLSAAEARNLQAYGEANWTVFGNTVGSRINQRIDVYEPAAASGLATSVRMQATVVAVRGFDKGDVAMLEVHTQQPLPVLQIATTEPANGAEVTAVGYPSAVRDVSDSSLDPSFETGHVNSIQTRNGLPVLQFDAGLSPGMSGGPVVNAEGQVVGVNSYRNSGETQQFNFAVDLSTIHAFLSSRNVDNTLSDADQAYRDGLDAYFAGNYSDAVDSFNVTLNELPSHALAQQYRSKATALVPDKQPETRNWTAIVIGAGASIALLMTGAGIFTMLLLRRRQGQDRGTMVAPMTTVGLTAPAPVVAAEAHVPSAGFVPTTPSHGAAPTIVVDRQLCGSCGNPRTTSAFCPATGASHSAAPGPQPINAQ